MDGPEFCSPPKRIILGNLNQNGGSPVSPMANLKLLTKVATSHFSVGENSEYDEIPLENRDLKTDSKPSRRLRSLSFICKKFLLLYKLDIPVGDSQQISLGNLALSLGIEKRRVYDIINVVSSLEMAVKVCKDKYYWYGNQNLPRLLTKLKAYALINKFDEQINAVLQNQMTLSESKESDSPYIKITRGDRSVFEENRIGILCQKFIMLFLVCNHDVALNMCTISKLILTGDVQEKTGMRRLYDIANVLEALDLIKRYHYKIMKKPAFKYCGPVIDIVSTNCEKLMPKKLPCTVVCETSDQGDTNSESSLDCVPAISKLDSILEVVCTEIEEENCRTLSSPITAIKRKYTDINNRIHCNAKKQLFPSPFVMKSMDTVNNTFIKAPKHSFRLECNELQIKETETAQLQNNNNDVPFAAVLKMEPMITGGTHHKYSNFRTNFSAMSRLEENCANNLKLGSCGGQTAGWPQQSISASISNESKIIMPSDKKNEIQNSKLILNKFPSNLISAQSKIAPTKIKVIRPTKISDIQNGGVYKVLKKGNTVQLYAL